jgi:hypothetical protein
MSYKVILTENDLHRIVKETVKRVLRETNNHNDNIIALAKNIVKEYFGGYLPNSLAEEGFECQNETELYNLITNIESYYISQGNYVPEELIESVHKKITEIVSKLNSN